MHNIDTDRRPLVCIWEVTQACDLACEHCRADAQRRRHPEELSTDEAKQLLDDLCGFGDNQLVVFSGGDPCKRPDLVELVEYGTDIGLTITLTPSGTSALTEDVIQDLNEAGLRRIALSIDGASADSHDTFRGEDGSYAETIRAAQAITDAGLPLQINTTVCQWTVEELPEIRDLVDELGAVMWSVFFLVPVGRGRVLEPISPERADRVMEWLGDVRENSSFALKTTEAPQYRRVQAQRNHSTRGSPEEERRRGVIAGDGFAFVSHIGEMFPSGFLPKSAGNVRESDPVELYRHSELFTQLRNRDALKGKCGACPFKHVCGGSRSRAFAYTGDPLSSDPLCPYVPPQYEGDLPTQTIQSD